MTNNGTLAFNRADAVTVANAIFGSGTLVQKGAGALSLTGVNSYAAIDNQSAIATLVNYKGGSTGALTYAGALPANYFIYVTSATHYGQLDVTSYTGAMSFNVASGSALANGTYANVITGVGDAGIAAARSGALNGYMWKLVQDTASALNWNLSVASSTVAQNGTLLTSGLVDNVDLTFNGGALGVDRAGAYNNNMKLGASANSIDLTGRAATFSGVLSDLSSGGAMRFTGAGTATLTGANTYTGVTTIDSGTTLQVGDGRTTGTLGSGIVIDNGTLAFKRADDITVANAISGSGALSIQGAGTTTLTGANTFSGGLTVGTGATLAISSSSALGSGRLALVGSATVTATLKVTGNTTISNPITVSGDPLFCVIPDTTTTITGAISDGASSGDVVVQGGGVLALAAANNYTGPTTIGSGSTLALRGSGAIAASASVANAGALDLRGLTGGATLGGSFSQTSSGTLFMRMAASGPQGLTIAGAASLDGVLSLTAAPGTYKSGVYRLLSAGSVAGAFSSFSSNLASFARLYSLSYSGGAVDLTLVLGPDAANTRRALSANSASLGAAMAQRVTTLANMMDYDCPAFDHYGVCLSFQARYSAMDSRNDGAGVLTTAWRLSPQVRLGGFIDQAPARNSVAGLKMDAQRPSFGAFLAFGQKPDGRGLQAKLSGAMNAGDVTVTRSSSLADTEAGSGKARLDSFAAGAELGYGVAWAGALTTTPYVGLRYTQTTRGAYQEAATQGMVDYPISYNAFHQRLGTATAGLRLNGMVSERIGLQAGAGVDFHFHRPSSAYTGASAIYGLETFSLPGALTARRLSAVGNAGLFYQIDRTQRLTGNVSVRGQAFSSQPAVSVMGGYQAAF